MGQECQMGETQYEEKERIIISSSKLWMLDWPVLWSDRNKTNNTSIKKNEEQSNEEKSDDIVKKSFFFF